MKKVLKKMSVLALALVMVCCYATSVSAVTQSRTIEYENVELFYSVDLSSYYDTASAVIALNDGDHQAEYMKITIDYVYYTNDEGTYTEWQDTAYSYVSWYGYCNAYVNPAVDNADTPDMEYYYGLYSAAFKLESDFSTNSSFVRYRPATITFVDEEYFE